MVIIYNLAINIKKKYMTNSEFKFVHALSQGNLKNTIHLTFWAISNPYSLEEMVYDTWRGADLT